MNELINSVTDYVAGSFVSTFIFGVLTGWLIEWLFYNFVWKSHSTSDDSNEAGHAQKVLEKTELEAKSNSEKSMESKQKTESKVSEAKDDAIKPHTETEAKVVVETEKEVKKEQIASKEKPKPSEKIKEAEETKADDLTKLLGIGPSMSKRLQEIGVNSFKKLSELSITELTEKLIANGARINNKGIMESWADQSRLADAGDFNALKSLQNKLKK